MLLHGFGDTGDMWAPLAARLMKDHTVVVPDLRGMGLSSHPETGYEKKNEAQDIAAVLNALKIDGPVALVTHDIGNMVAYAFAAQNRDRVTRWVVMDAPLPGLGHWTDDSSRSPRRGISTSTDRTRSGSSPAASASTSTVSTMNCRRIRKPHR